MKKYFSIALVIVTVGAAVTSVYATDYYLTGATSPSLKCTYMPSPTCSQAVNGQPLYLNPGPGNQGPAVNPSQAMFDSY